MFRKVLIANRGEIAVRILGTLRKMGIGSVAICSEADRDSPHVRRADEFHLVGPAPVAQSYLNQARLLEVIGASGAEAVHPGYGLLSENAEFAEACEAAGCRWLGPTPEQIRQFGLKHTAREVAERAEVPLVPGTDLLESCERAVAAARGIGFPVILKSTAGGGGIGMAVCGGPEEVAGAFARVQRLGEKNFGQAGVFLEKFVERARHVEVQIFGDGEGRVLALGERDCSVQRRNQKVIEESPAPGLRPETRAAMMAAAVRLGERVGYRSAGTVEFLYDDATGRFYFLEVNTRLQVEHGVTELVTGIDLVEWMVRLGAEGGGFLEAVQVEPEGHAIEVRLYAENPQRDFLPCAGQLTKVDFPTGVRCDTWVESGVEVSAYYDPLVAKLLVHGATRAEAAARMAAALRETTLAGIETNLRYLAQVVSDPVFLSGGATTRWLEEFSYAPRCIEVERPGTQTTVQDWPGRLGYWDVGVPPSGPMDPLAFRLANRLVGNDEEAAGLEITHAGPALRFRCEAVVAVTGAPVEVTIDGEVALQWESVVVKQGALLEIGRIERGGFRCYLAVRGGIDVPRYLGSGSTFTMGQFGGHAGRALRVADGLHLGDAPQGDYRAARLSQDRWPEYPARWEIGVYYGPHGAPEFFTAEDIECFFATDWEVHFNSARTGVRLVGPHPRWARADGGEAGLHPSNIHDNAYAIGTIDFTGNMPVILGPDGPSLGGFVCPATVVQGELWKVGQLRPGDRIRFVPISERDAAKARRACDALVADLAGSLFTPPAPAAVGSDVVARADELVIRQSGDAYLLLEIGPLVLDLALRFRVQQLYDHLRERSLPWIIDLTPGIRSLQVHFDPERVDRGRLIETIVALYRELPEEGGVVPARIVHLPLSWDDPATRLAIEKYMAGVNPDAPWCPSNLEFIRRINGLETIEEVKRIVYEASYLVLGLGDVYLGAPVATPLDPRHRLVTTKYNPARTWTPENAVGIGGAYLCIYGMEGPGGYQFVGRTVPMWNRFRSTEVFEAGKPWLLRCFDQIRFYEVEAEELLDLRRKMLLGDWNPRIEETRFDLTAYAGFLGAQAGSIEAFRVRQQTAFAAERERWRAAGLDLVADDDGGAGPAEEIVIPDGCVAVESPMSGAVWKVEVRAGGVVEEKDLLIVLEAMKMELAVEAPAAGTVREILVRSGDTVGAGEVLAIIETKNK